MQRTTAFSRLGQTLVAAKRRFSTSTSKSGGNEKIVASVLFERLPVVTPKIDPVVYAFQEFLGQGDHQFDYTPALRITEVDKSNDKRSLERALDKRLYLLVLSTSNGAPVWHFPEKVYESGDTSQGVGTHLAPPLAESALQSVIGDLSHTYFVGNAPMGHMVLQPPENKKVEKRFFFKSQVVDAKKFNIGECEDYVWVAKDELLGVFSRAS